MIIIYQTIFKLTYMQKLFISRTLICLFFLGSIAAKAQIFEKGTKLVDAGFQLQSDYIPIFANFETGVTDDIGVGAKSSFAKKNHVGNMGIQLVGNYHFNRLLKLPVEKLDLLAGLGLGVQLVTYKFAGDSDSQAAFLSTPFVGSRYFFTDKIGAMAKVGFDIYRYKNDYGYYGSAVETFTRASFALGVTFKL
ncbi:hypothetical protein [Dyadobacter sp. LHD-138]|uniref:hypothetical protein n=1 Tax=Dyadobacter sp. LHD-138 TaxID=3071413 RepID=UPI0027DF423A|nr:hypothetical protein [Dyadobacter sp. LHD-138]MDQ6481918.1 hypothetical protein [Dyadobacter sp. LHD-138]